MQGGSWYSRDMKLGMTPTRQSTEYAATGVAVNFDSTIYNPGFCLIPGLPRKPFAVFLGEGFNVGAFTLKGGKVIG